MLDGAWRRRRWRKGWRTRPWSSRRPTGQSPAPSPVPLSPCSLPSPSLPSHLPPPYPSSSPLPLPPPLPSLPPSLTINSPQMTPLWVLGRIDYFCNLPIILFHESQYIQSKTVNKKVQTELLFSRIALSLTYAWLYHWFLSYNDVQSLSICFNAARLFFVCL